MSWERLPLRRKIQTVVAITSVGSLQLAALLLIGYQWRAARTGLAGELATMADVVGASSAASLQLQESPAADRSLQRLSLDRRVSHALIRTTAGRTLSFGAPGGAARPEPPRAAGVTFSRDTVTVVRPIEQDGRLLGTIAVTAALDQMHQGLARSALAIFLAIALCAGAAIYLSDTLSRRVLRPIITLSQVAHAVSRSKDYALRAPKVSDDELGELTETFNEMLGQVQEQREALQDTHRELRDGIAQLERVRQRERELRERLARSERMESLGILAGGVAHDLNNILGPMVGYPDLMIDKLAADSPMRRQVLAIKESAVRAAAIIQDLLTLARRGGTGYQRSALRLPELVRQFLDGPEMSAHRRRFPKVELQQHVAQDVPLVAASEPHLIQVLMNLVINACEAMPKGGTALVAVRALSLAEDHVGYERIPAGSYVVLRVSDQGDGISADDLAHLFEPFYTKKEMGRSGSGLGLAVVWGVVKDLGGYVDIKSRIAVGSTFEVYLPTAEDGVAAVESGQEVRGSESILVVDDERAQRELAVEVLSSLGYAVSSCRSGRAALAFLDVHPPPHLLMLDMVMEADFDGLMTLQHVRARFPDLRCIIASGFAEDERFRQATALGAGYVAKPYTREVVGRAVRSALDQPPATAAVSI